MRRLYNWVTGHVPDKVLHLAVCFIVSLGSWEVAVGLAAGRESGNIAYPERYGDSLLDLFFDGIGIVTGTFVKNLWT